LHLMCSLTELHFWWPNPGRVIAVSRMQIMRIALTTRHPSVHVLEQPHQGDRAVGSTDVVIMNHCKDAVDTILKVGIIIDIFSRVLGNHDLDLFWFYVMSQPDSGVAGRVYALCGMSDRAPMQIG
jgi:hypothetical protein